jgi:hypothetical protein
LVKPIFCWYFVRDNRAARAAEPRHPHKETTMAVDVTRTLQQALQSLESERARIDRQIRTIRAAMGGGGAGRGAGGGGRRRRRMTAAARKAVSQRMKAYWAARRAKKAKAAK